MQSGFAVWAGYARGLFWLAGVIQIPFGVVLLGDLAIHPRSLARASARVAFALVLLILPGLLSCLAAKGRPDEGLLQMIQVICALDRCDLEAARRHLDNAMAQISSPDKAPDPPYASEMALYIALIDGHAQRASLWLRGAEEMAEQRKVSLTRDFDYWLACAAVRRAEGLRMYADEAAVRATELATAKPNAGLYQFERELLELVLSDVWLQNKPQSTGLRELHRTLTGGQPELSSPRALLS